MAFKCIRQLDSMQCGIACISTIATHYGKHLSIRHLESYCQPGKDGVSLLGIYNCARFIGFKTDVIATTASELKNIKKPCIIHWNKNHFVVLYAYNSKKNIFKIADPAKGLRYFPEKEFISHWSEQSHKETASGIAMILEPTSEFYSTHIQDFSKKYSLKFLLKHIRPFKKELFTIIAGLFIGCLLQLILPFLTKWIVDFGILYRDINPTLTPKKFFGVKVGLGN